MIAIKHEETAETYYEPPVSICSRCAGLDVHKDTVVAAIRLAINAELTTEVQTFSTATPGLLALADWLSEHACTHVAMEATGVYWKPVWHILADGTFTLILTNPAMSKTSLAARPTWPMRFG